ncbi:MAG: aminopeptidase P family protein [Desulfobacteraceae bacterium]|nr:MAG: aminopeptidase P family protein [Desulfobacteraceae bacterium]
MKKRNRIRIFQESLERNGWQGAILFYSRDIFYYTGTAQPSWFLVTPEEHLLFVRSGFDFAVTEVFIEKERMVGDRQFTSVVQKLKRTVSNGKIATELDLLPANQYKLWQYLLDEYEIVDASPAILAQRRMKDSSEMEKIKKACEAQEAGHRAVFDLLRPGTSELELAAGIENAHRLAGHEGVVFMRLPDFFMSRGPIGSGNNLSRFSGVIYSVTGVGLSPAVPVGPSKKRIEDGDLVIVDIPVQVEGYHADQTRTYCLGKAETEVRDLHQAMIEISDCVIGHAMPGIRCCDLFEVGMEKANECGVADAYLSFGKGRKSHMIGHGIGLECTEPPIISLNDQSFIQENDVLAVEMHMFRQSVGVVKIEDMFRVGSSQNEILTKTPRVLLEVTK